MLFHLIKLIILSFYLRFPTSFKGSFGFGKYPFYGPCPLCIRYVFVFDNICFRICFRCSRIRFHFRKKYENKCGTTEFRPYRLRFHPYLQELLKEFGCSPVIVESDY